MLQSACDVPRIERLGRYLHILDACVEYTYKHLPTLSVTVFILNATYLYRRVLSILYCLFFFFSFFIIKFVDLKIV